MFVFDITAEDKFYMPFEKAKSSVRLIAPEMDKSIDAEAAWLFGENSPYEDEFDWVIAVLKGDFEVMPRGAYVERFGEIERAKMRHILYRSGELVDESTEIFYGDAKLIANKDERYSNACEETDDYWHFYDSEDPEDPDSVVVNKYSGIVSFFGDWSEDHGQANWRPIDYMTGFAPGEEMTEQPALVQSFINNIAFPSSLKEVQEIMNCRGRYNVEDFECTDAIDWTVPKWCKAGDICFFMHGKSAIVKIRSLKRQLKKNRHCFSENEYTSMEWFLCHGEDLYEKYGGKVYAIGIVSDKPYYLKNSDTENTHWRGHIYATIGNIHILEHPIHRDEISSFIAISSAAAITPVFGEQFERLKSIVIERNTTLQYFRDCKAMPIPLAKIDDENWLELCNKYRHQFILEYQFRSFFVDRLLKALGDRKQFYAECPCYKDKIKPSYVDNVISFCGRYLPVECKISVPSEMDIKGQVHKYCQLKRMVLDGERGIEADLDEIYSDFVLIIDTDHIYIFDDNAYSISILASLDGIRTEQDIHQLRYCIAEKLNADPRVRMKPKRNIQRYD